MDASVKNELYQMKTELQSIINELYSISAGVSNDFHGIGNDKCSSCILKIITQYENAKKKLDSMDFTNVSEEFDAKQKAAEVAVPAVKTQITADDSISKSGDNDINKKNSIWGGMLGWPFK